MITSDPALRQGFRVIQGALHVRCVNAEHILTGNGMMRQCFNAIKASVNKCLVVPGPRACTRPYVSDQARNIMNPPSGQKLIDQDNLSPSIIRHQGSESHERENLRLMTIRIAHRQDLEQVLMFMTHR
jgi:hypothetical protein